MSDQRQVFVVRPAVTLEEIEGGLILLTHDGDQELALRRDELPSLIRALERLAK